MTCRERLKIEHPEYVGSCYAGGCEGCPKDYGYLDDPAYCANRFHRGFLEHKCGICWDREIPDYEDRETLKDILSGMESEERYERKSVSEMLEENAKLTRMLESKNGLIGTLKQQLRKTQDELSAMNKSYYEMEDDLLRRLSKADREARLYRHLNDILSDRLKDLGEDI